MIVRVSLSSGDKNDDNSYTAKNKMNNRRPSSLCSSSTTGGSTTSNNNNNNHNRLVAGRLRSHRYLNPYRSRHRRHRDCQKSLVLLSIAAIFLLSTSSTTNFMMMLTKVHSFPISYRPSIPNKIIGIRYQQQKLPPVLQQQHSISNNNIAATAWRTRSRCCTVAATTSDDSISISDTDSEDSVADGVDDYYNPNQIHPKTKTLKASVALFARVAYNMVRDSRRKQRLLSLLRRQNGSPASGAKRRRFLTSFRKLNEQRRNLVALADYTAKIVVPSFSCLIAGAFMVSVIPHYYSRCIQLVATLDSNAAALSSAVLGLFLTSTAAAALTGLRGSMFWIAGSRANYNVRCKLHRNLLLQEASFFDNTDPGTLLSRLNSDVNKIGQVISYHVNVVLRQFAQFLFGSVYLIRISPLLSLYAFSGILLVALVAAVYGKFNNELSRRVQDSYADGTAVAETAFSMSETIRAFDGVTQETEKYQAAQSVVLNLEETQAWGYGMHKFVSDTLEAALQVLLLLACWRLGRAQQLKASSLTTFLFYTNFVLQSSNEVGDQWAKIQGAVGASTSVFDLIRRQPKIRDPSPQMATATEENGTTVADAAVRKDSRTVKQHVEEYREDQTHVEANAASNEEIPVPSSPLPQSTPIIEMSNVTLTYHGTDDVPALSEVELSIFEGDRVAVVGRSGSGKSSVLRAISRFYDPDKGCIRLSGTPLPDMTRKEMVSKIAVVEQEPSLFPMTLHENVLYGIEHDARDPVTGQSCYSATYKRAAEEALEEAGLPVHEGNDLNLCLETRVGPGGRTLSGGQRQRVAVARALVRKPDVILLDEPTAALDSASERAVVAALQSALRHSKSMVMVTHRLGVVSALGVNRVVVLDKGRIVEEGHPEILLRNEENGWYSSLAREQGITVDTYANTDEVLVDDEQLDSAFA